MEKAINTLLNFFDNLDCGQIIAQTIRDNRQNIENGKIPFFVNDKNTKSFETFIDKYNLQAYHDKMKILLVTAYFANFIYYQQGMLNRRKIRDRKGNSINKDNKPLKNDLELFKDYDFSLFDYNMDDIMEQYGNNIPLNKLMPCKINSISITVNNQNKTIKSRDILDFLEDKLNKKLKEYYDNGYISNLQNIPDDKKKITEFGIKFLKPIYYYIKEIYIHKDVSNEHIYKTVIDFWQLFYPKPHSSDWLRKIIKTY